MNKPNSGVSNLVQELRNRRVFRASAVYLGVGYAILEASSIIVPMMELPEIIVKIILGLLLIGFPIAIVLAWVFQVTPEGIRRSPKSGEKQSDAQKPLTGNSVIIALLLIIAGLLTLQQFSGKVGGEMSESTGVDMKSIAVLPFTPFTKTEDDQSFADGMHDDILTQLSKIGDLKVISRTSVMQYKETTKLISDIAKELGVVNILEGSIRRSGDKVRVVAQLINARTDEHLWAETFDRQLKDIFSVQTEVAKRIAGALKAELTPQEQKYIEAKPTEDQEAWQLYLRAQLLNVADVIEKDSVAVMFDQAVQLDPDFLLPYVRLTRIHAYKYFDGTGTDPTPERLAVARQNLDRAISIAPEAPETRMAQGFFHYYGSRDYNKALEEFSIALEMQPNNSDLFAATAYVERRLGKYDDALENLKKAVALDPNNALKVEEALSWAFQMRDWELANQYFEQLSAIHSGKDASVERVGYHLETARSGDLTKMQVIHDQLLEKFSPDELFSLRIRHATFTGDYEKALEMELSDSTSSFLDIADLLVMLGKDEQAQSYYDSARIEAETVIQENPNDWEAYGELAVALASMGKCDEAIRWGEKEKALMPLSRDGLLGTTVLEDLANIHMLCGNMDEAMDYVEQILELPGYVSVNYIRLSPFMNPLSDLPRFQALLKKYEP